MKVNVNNIHNCWPLLLEWRHYFLDDVPILISLNVWLVIELFVWVHSSTLYLKWPSSGALSNGSWVRIPPSPSNRTPSIKKRNFVCRWCLFCLKVFGLSHFWLCAYWSVSFFDGFKSIYLSKWRLKLSCFWAYLFTI